MDLTPTLKEGENSAQDTALSPTLEEGMNPIQDETTEPDRLNTDSDIDTDQLLEVIDKLLREKTRLLNENAELRKIAQTEDCTCKKRKHDTSYCASPAKKRKVTKENSPANSKPHVRRITDISNLEDPNRPVIKYKRLSDADRFRKDLAAKREMVLRGHLRFY